MIKIEKIFAGYAKNQVLKNVNLNVKKNDFFGIIGKNGAGKSTLLKVIAKLLKPYTGNVLIDAENINSFSKKRFAQKVAFLPQYVDMSLNFPVKDFIIFGRYPHMNILKIPLQKDYTVLNKVMEFLKIPHLINKNVNELSGGEKQVVLIAQVLVQETDIVLFDEPVSHLDIGKQNTVLEILRKLNTKFNKTIVLSLHDLNLASEFCNAIAFMENGSIYKYGAPTEILNAENIAKIYNVKVLIRQNPVSKKMFVIPLSKSADNYHTI
ncbi:MAG: ABC transporter ATP-binding protein [Endomicrobium sp.]|jgi:iron complex transport system ATP-binding protein|nr:ABC transporter ATP-binding protein [Endomicrobium sp.]